MDITSLNRDKIKYGLERASSKTQNSGRETRLLFSAIKITDENFDSVCRAYSQLKSKNFNTVVVVESNPGDAEKKLAMPSFKVVKTHLGEVAANDKLRNDFADEDDDFFINDNAFDEDVSLYHQLVMLQCVLDDFTVSHIQITDENSIIVKELALAVEEILASKNALIVCCCNLEKAVSSEIENVMQMLDSENDSRLMNYLNSGDSNIEGVGSFVTGLLIAKKWGLIVNFTSAPKTGKIQTGFAVVQNKPIFG